MSEIEPPPVDTDTLFEVLANRWRRHLVWCLSEHDQPVALTDLARDVSAREQNQSQTKIPAEEVKRVATMLYHWHIPCLCDKELLTYDCERRTVASTNDLNKLRKTWMVAEIESN